MALSLGEIKDLISFGRELGLQQLQTEGLVAVYGPRPGAAMQPSAPTDNGDDTANILAHYSAIGREKLASRR